MEIHSGVTKYHYNLCLGCRLTEQPVSHSLSPCQRDKKLGGSNIDKCSGLEISLAARWPAPSILVRARKIDISQPVT